MSTPPFAGFSSATLGELVDRGWLTIRNGHGSAPKDLRAGDVPYIKVSDLRAGLVNINPTNRVPRKWAEKMWRGPDSGLQAYDLIPSAPARTSVTSAYSCRAKNRSSSPERSSSCAPPKMRRSTNSTCCGR